MKIDNGVEITFEKIDLQNHFFKDMEKLERVMQKKMMENSRKEAASIAYAIEHDNMYGSV